MFDCPYTITKEWIVSGVKPILKVCAIDADGSIVDSIERKVSLDGRLDLRDYEHQSEAHLKEDIEKAIEQELIVRLKHFGKF